MTSQDLDADEGPQTDMAPRQPTRAFTGESASSDADSGGAGLSTGTALSRHWESLDSSAAELLGAVERSLETDPAHEDILNRPSGVATALARARANAPSLAMPASPERPKRWITALLVIVALATAFTTPAAKVDAGGSPGRDAAPASTSGERPKTPTP